MGEATRSNFLQAVVNKVANGLKQMETALVNAGTKMAKINALHTNADKTKTKTRTKTNTNIRTKIRTRTKTNMLKQMETALVNAGAKVAKVNALHGNAQEEDLRNYQKDAARYV